MASICQFCNIYFDSLKTVGLLISLFLIHVLCTDVIAQGVVSKQLKGIVMDEESGDGLSGVHIFAKVAHAGVVSDAKGKFSMRVHPQDTLVITIVGYERQIVPLRYFREATIDIIVQMRNEVIELPGITIHGQPNVEYLERSGQNPYKIYQFRPPPDHPNLDVPIGSMDYGPLSRWGKEAKEKRQLLKIYSSTSKDRVFIQTVTSDSVMQVFMYRYDLDDEEYNDFILYFNSIKPSMNPQDPKDIIRAMHLAFLNYRPG